MSATVVIELGTDWAPPPDPTVPVNRRRRTWTVGCLLLALLLGGAAPARPALRPVIALPSEVGDGFTLGDHQIFLVGRGPAGVAQVAAYELPEGTLTWVTPLPEGVDWVQEAGAAHVLLVRTASPSGGDPRVAALDQETGRLLWAESNVEVLDVRPSAGRLLLDTPGAGTPLGLHLVDLRSGRVLWSRTLPIATRMTTTPAEEADPGWLLLGTATGVEVISEETGQQMASGVLLPAEAQARPVWPGGPGLTVLHDLALTSFTSNGDTVVAGYQLPGLTRRWQVLVPGLAYYLVGCAELVCVLGENTTTALDPATGAVRWHTDAWAPGLTFGGYLAANNPRPSGDRAVLLDPATGRVLLDLERWTLLSSLGSGTAVLLTRDEPGELGGWFGALSATSPPGRPSVRPLGQLFRVVPQNCQVSELYLACTTVAGPIQVWRYRLS